MLLSPISFGSDWAGEANEATTLNWHELQKKTDIELTVFTAISDSYAKMTLWKSETYLSWGCEALDLILLYGQGKLKEEEEIRGYAVLILWML